MEKIDAFKAEIDTGVVINDDITLMAYALRWYPLKVAGLKPKSRDVYRNALDVHILPRLGNLPIRDIKALHIEELMADLACKSASMHSKILFTIKQILNSAVENGIIIKNPCAKKKAGGQKAKIKTPLTHEQQDALREAVKGTRAELFTLLCLYAGLRREEALGLLWSNVHLDCKDPYLDVRHTTTYDRNGVPTHSESLKSSAAYRSIPLPPQLTEALSRRKSDMDSAFIVPAERSNKEMSLIAFRRMWESVNKGLVSFHVEPHQLRHTYITELCASGMDIKKIQYLAGHATVQMTLNVYTHVTQNRPEQIAPDIVKAFLRTP